MNLPNLLQESLPYLSQYGLFLVFAGALIEGETIIILSGVLCHQGLLPLEWTIITATLGAFTGDQVWFHLGHRYGNKLLDRFPRLAVHARKVRPWLEKKSDWIAAGSRFVYGTRTIAPILLGMHDYSGLRFVFINSISASLWAVMGIGVGYLAGAGAEQLFGQIKHVEQLFLVIILVILLRWWYRYRNLKRATGEKHV